MSSKPFVDLASSVTRYCDTFIEVMNKYSSEWQPGSPAASEAAAEPMAGAWAQYPARDACRSSILMAHAVIDHLRAMALLLESTWAMHSVVTCARGAFEAALQGFYLAEPGIGSRERVRRYMNMRLAAAHEQKLLFKGLPSNPRAAAMLAEVEAKLDTLLASGKDQGLTPKKSRSQYGAPFLDSETPSLLQLSKQLFADEDSHLGPFYWRTLSAVAHSQIHGLAGYYQPVAHLLDHTHGDALVAVTVSSKDTALRLFAVLIAAFAMALRLADLMGWDKQPLLFPALAARQVWTRVAGLPA